VTGILAAQSAVVARVARELDQLAVSAAPQPESIARRLRRTLSDPHLDAATCYAPVLPRVVEWAELAAGGEVVLVADESSKADEVHLFRLSLAYWGGSLPLAWAAWEQNVALPDGGYWGHVEAVLTQAAALLPPDVAVVVLADCAYDVPEFVDRVAAHGWRWIVRCKAKSALRFRDRTGRERRLADILSERLPAAGGRWRGRGEVFKKAGWRTASVVAIWGQGQVEPLVVLTDGEPRWAVLRRYERRFWIEAGFRSDKAKGWRWEESQVRGVAHHARLLLGMAWASLVALCLGVAEAQERLARLAATPVRLRRRQQRPGRPRHARESVFTLGLACLRGWLYQTARRPLRWVLPEVEAVSWQERWYQAQAHRFLFAYPVRP
jgi:hypothetical protein